MSDSPETDVLRKEMEQLRRDLASLTESVKSRSNDELRAGIESARGQIGELGDEIEARPFTSVLAAFGIGLLLGKVFSR